MVNSDVFRVRRFPINLRYYTDEDILKYQGLNLDKLKCKIVVYAKVSSHNLKFDLKHKIEFIPIFVNSKGIILAEVIETISGGLNYTRPKWNQLLQVVMRSEIDKSISLTKLI